MRSTFVLSVHCQLHWPLLILYFSVLMRPLCGHCAVIVRFIRSILRLWGLDHQRSRPDYSIFAEYLYVKRPFNSIRQGVTPPLHLGERLKLQMPRGFPRHTLFLAIHPRKSSPSPANNFQPLRSQHCLTLVRVVRPSIRRGPLQTSTRRTTRTSVRQCWLLSGWKLITYVGRRWAKIANIFQNVAKLETIGE